MLDCHSFQRIGVHVINRTGRDIVLKPDDFALEVEHGQSSEPIPRLDADKLAESIQREDVLRSEKRSYNDRGFGGLYSGPALESHPDRRVSVIVINHEQYILSDFVRKTALSTAVVKPGADFLGGVYFKQPKKKSSGTVKVTIGNDVMEFPFQPEKARIAVQ